VAEEEELEARELFKRMGVKVVEEDEELEDEGGVDRRVTLEAVAQSLAREHGRCRAAYLLRTVYGLEPREIARLLGANPSTVRVCIHNHRKRDGRAELELRPPLLAFKRYGELCKDVYSLKCQMLEAEMFMYHVARHAAPRLPVWVSLYLRAASIHRLLFHEVYPLLQAYARAVGADFRGLVRAYRPRGSSFWTVGDGLLAYTYAVLGAALHMLGHHHRHMELSTAIRQLTNYRKNPADPKLTPIVVAVAARLAQLLHERLEEVYRVEKELERELMKALGKAKG
jgi:hypothetical protein